MSANTVVPGRVELVNHHPNNRLLIENHTHRVVIRAVRDNFSPRERAAFVRYLAAEGFIPARYQGLVDAEADLHPALSWKVDGSWLAEGSETQRHRLGQILRVLLGAGLLWLGLMTYAFLQTAE